MKKDFVFDRNRRPARLRRRAELDDVSRGEWTTHGWVVGRTWLVGLVVGARLRGAVVGRAGIVGWRNLHRQVVSADEGEVVERLDHGGVGKLGEGDTWHTRRLEAGLTTGTVADGTGHAGTATGTSRPTKDSTGEPVGRDGDSSRSARRELEARVGVGDLARAVESLSDTRPDSLRAGVLDEDEVHRVGSSLDRGSDGLGGEGGDGRDGSE